MKKFFLFFVHNPMILALVFILVVFLPTSISVPPEGVQRQHISTIGIDLAPNGVELSVLAHVAKNSDNYNEVYVLNSATANSIPEALFKISSASGRQVSLTHTTAIAVSEKILQFGLHNVLDYFYRNDNIANDTFVVCSVNSSAKDLLNFEKERINSTSYGLEELLVYNSKNTFFVQSDIENFYKGYFSPTKTSVVALAELEENPDAEQTLQSGGGQGGGGQSGGQPQKRVKTAGTLGILKSGFLVDKMTEQDIFGFNLVNNQTHNIFLTIEDFSDELFYDATVQFNIVTNKISYISTFENNRPVFTINSLVSLALESVLANQVDKEYFYNNVNPLSPKMKAAIVQKLRQTFSSFMKKMIADKTDVFGVYTILNNQHPAKFKKWMQSLDDPENFLAFIEFRMSANPILTT